jgi:hypothetical protein
MIHTAPSTSRASGQVTSTLSLRHRREVGVAGERVLVGGEGVGQDGLADALGVPVDVLLALDLDVEDERVLGGEAPAGVDVVAAAVDRAEAVGACAGIVLDELGARVAEQAEEVAAVAVDEGGLAARGLDLEGEAEVVHLVEVGAAEQHVARGGAHVHVHALEGAERGHGGGAAPQAGEAREQLEARGRPGRRRWWRWLLLEGSPLVVGSSPLELVLLVAASVLAVVLAVVLASVVSPASPASPQAARRSARARLQRVGFMSPDYRRGAAATSVR